MMDLHDIELPTLSDGSLDLRPWRTDDVMYSLLPGDPRPGR